VDKHAITSRSQPEEAKGLPHRGANLQTPKPKTRPSAAQKYALSSSTLPLPGSRKHAATTASSRANRALWAAADRSDPVGSALLDLGCSLEEVALVAEMQHRTAAARRQAQRAWR
jgi:hypothetical protein